MPTGTPWSVWLFWTEDWAFRGWYVNLEDPTERVGVEAVTQDHVLDLVIHPDRRIEWKDEDELEAAVCSRRFSPGEAARFRANGQAAAEVAAARGSPFGDGWEHWRPDQSWSAPSLPAALVAAADYS